MILSAHPTGNPTVRYATQGFVDAGLLIEHWMCASWDPAWPFARFVPGPLRSQLERRIMPADVRPYIRHHPWREMGRMLSSQLGWAYPGRHEEGPVSIYAVYRALDRRVARRLHEVKGVRAVYAFEDSAAATFAAARELGIKAIYDQPIGYWRAAHKIYDEEAEREPAWASTMSGILDSEAKLALKDAEIEAADVVIAASTFTRDTIALAPRCTAPIHVIPYGSPPPVAGEPAPRPAGAPLRALFVGSLGQRKGLSYMFDAVEQMRGAVELTLIGHKVVPDCAALNAAVARHRWIPTLPHQGVLREMAEHDLLLFPSLFEGFGLVILESMAQGLPVLTTPQTAGPDLITDSVDGFIVPMRSATAIAQKLDLLVRDRPLLSAMKIAARSSASRRTWTSYQHQLLQAIRNALPA